MFLLFLHNETGIFLVIFREPEIRHSAMITIDYESSRTIRSQRGMDHDKGQVLRRGIQFERSAIFDNVGLNGLK